jgi:hypothetical protein
MSALIVGYNNGGNLLRVASRFSEVTTDTPSVRECFLHSRTQKVADHLSERLILRVAGTLSRTDKGLSFVAQELSRQ